MKNFPNGIWFKEVSEKQKGFMIGRLVIKKEDFIKWASAQDGDFINLDILISHIGNPYLSVNDWKPKENAGKKDDTLNLNSEKEVDIMGVPF